MWPGFIGKQLVHFLGELGKRPRPRFGLRQSRVLAALSSKFLDDMALHAARRKLSRDIQGLVIRQQQRMHGGAGLKIHARRQQQGQAILHRRSALRHAGDARVILERRLHVYAHPVDEGQHRRQALRIHAAGVQTDPVAKRFHHLQRLGQARLQGRLPTREHHAVEQALAAPEKIQHFGPGHGALPARQQVRVVAVGAAPGAALAEHHGGEPAGKINGGERHQAAHRQPQLRHGSRAGHRVRRSGAVRRARPACPD